MNNLSNEDSQIRVHTSTRNGSSRRKSNNFQINEELLGTSTVHKNLNHDIIITTTDKINLALIQQEKYLHSKKDWITPLSIVLAVLASLAAADFKPFIGISADSWKAIFIIIGVSSAAWLIKCLYCAFIYRNKGSNHEFIERLKKDGNSDLYDLINK
ncbi:hypothetical protein ACWIE6_10875 [Paenibacillus taichungensis]